MAATHNPPDCHPDESWLDQLRCLPRGMIPMPEDQHVRVVEKLVALLLVTVWSLVFLGLSFEVVNATEPRFWGIFSAIVFLLVGKLWNLEVQKYLPGPNTTERTDGGPDHNDATTDGDSNSPEGELK
jgi:hypothetical protein